MRTILPKVSLAGYNRNIDSLFSYPMTPAGKKTIATDGSLSTHNGFSLISNEKLLEIYSTMLKCRMLEERIHAVAKTRKYASALVTTSVHVAAIAGAAIDLLPGDTLAPSHGAFTPCFAKGMQLPAVFAFLFRSKTLPSPSFSALNIIPPSLSPARQLERAMSVAAAYRSKRNKKAVAVFSSDASCAAQDLDDAMMLAGKKKLPVLFVHETKSHADDRLKRAREYGFPGVAVEDDDAVAVYRVATEALAHARRGNGATLVECKPWPFDPKAGGKRRHAMHPIGKMEAYLASKGLFNRGFKSKLIAEFSRELDAAVKAALR
jgi:TPP-dependent pyruvate/acetoin dehydrogenase alpha subunit